MLPGAELPEAVPGRAPAAGHGAGGHLAADWTHRFPGAACIACPKVAKVSPRQGCFCAQPIRRAIMKKIMI